ncbi:MAG: hypothetical protein IKW28_02955 [Lachnospiraceae bacterium]|nr:hypothetical protein [Lachnospiraceae bacterium]
MKQNFMNKLERKFAKYAIHNLSLYLILCYGFGYIISMVNSNFFQFLTLEPALILKGQIWRLFTWIVVPPSGSNILFTLIMLYFYYSLGNNMERVWGTFKFNVYIFSGMLFTIAGTFLAYFILFMSEGTGVIGIGLFVSTYYINMSILLAYAATFPEMQIVMLLFIIPVPMKVKWLGILYAFMLVMEAVQAGLVGKIIILASLLNFILFFLSSRNKKYVPPKRTTVSYQEGKEVVKKMRPITRHKCAICGRTEESNPDLEFRFCSKCNGNYEYCQDHLFTHEHVQGS